MVSAEFGVLMFNVLKLSSVDVEGVMVYKVLKLSGV